MQTSSKHLHKLSGDNDATPTISPRRRNYNKKYHKRYRARHRVRLSKYVLEQIGIMTSLAKFSEENALSDEEIDKKLMLKGLPLVHSYNNLKKLGVLNPVLLTSRVGRRYMPKLQRVGVKRTITESMIVRPIIEREAAKMIQEGNLNPSNAELRARLKKAFTPHA